MSATSRALPAGPPAPLRITRIEGPSVGFVSTYPPTKCGIATFTASLREAMALRRSGVVASVDVPGVARFGGEVVAELVSGSRSSLARAAAALDRFDVAIVQHEFGIYGGRHGQEVVDLADALACPVIVVLHTVLRSPSVEQRSIVEQLAERAALVVVQSSVARARLLDAHAVPPERVRVVPHGAPPNFSPHDGRIIPGRRPVVLSWGLLSSGKGIEFGIDAMALLHDLDPSPRYVVHGETHPRVFEREGDAYRELLEERVRRRGLEDVVEFDDGYLGTASVPASIRAADVVLLPYRSRDQAVSGVLVEAIASGKPVVATGFPHARELLARGSGIVVPHDDSAAIAEALRDVLRDPERRARMAAAARARAPALFWGNVGGTYRELAALAAAAPARRRLP